MRQDDMIGGSQRFRYESSLSDFPLKKSTFSHCVLLRQSSPKRICDRRWERKLTTWDFMLEPVGTPERLFRTH